jgi:hypothetical protein
MRTVPNASAQPGPDPIHRSAWKVNSAKLAWPRPNTYECPGRISASPGYCPYFLIIPFGESCPFVGFPAHRGGAERRRRNGHLV